MNTDRLLRKVYGCLAGVACGDAMGMPTSMMSPESIRSVFPGGIHSFMPPPEGHPIHSGLAAGQVTDDTQQTLLVADSILEDNGVDPGGIARRLLGWAERMDAFGSLLLGPSTLKALRSIKEGCDIEKAGMFGDTNGACMRIAPVGIIHMGDVESTVVDVARACLPTHNTNIAIAGAAAVACAVGYCLRGTPPIDEVIDVAMKGVRRGMKEGTQWIGASILRRTEMALDIARPGRPEVQVLTDLYELVGAGVAVTETVPVCLALVKYGNGDPVRTITLAANLGGDADTIGAIAGAISGAYAGIDAFPESYLEIVERVNRLNLERYAHRLVDYVASGDGAD